MGEVGNLSSRRSLPMPYVSQAIIVCSEDLWLLSRVTALPKIRSRGKKRRLRGDKRTRRASIALAATSLVVAIVVLAANGLGTAVPARPIVPYSPETARATAVCFMLVSGGVLLWWHESQTASELAFGLGATAGLFVAANAGIRIFGSLAGEWTIEPMPYATMAEFLLASYCLCGLARRRFWHPRVFSFAITAGLLAALVAVVGYIFGSRNLTEVLILDAMAPQTSVSFVLVTLSLLLARPDASWLGLLLAPGAGSSMARRLFPIAIAGSLLLCFVVHVMTNVGLFSSGFRLGLLAIALMTLSAVAVLWNARTENRNEFLAFHDPLTGLANRARFAERLAEAMARADESGGKVGLVLCDLDRFKSINDRMGHLFGDTLLRLTSERLRRALRSSDTPARIGGDEFAAILADRKTERAIKSDATKVRETVAQPTEIHHHRFEPRASFGIAIYPIDAFEIDTLMRRADLALYDAKSDPHTDICYFDESLAAAAEHRSRIESELRDAMQQGDMLLYYQPQVDLATRRVRGVEALVRWRRRDHLRVGPDEFIPIAEASGLIRPLGRWIVTEACRQQAQWRAAGLDVTMAINVSPKEAADSDFPGFVDEVLDAAGLDGGSIEFEITEGLLLEHEGSPVQRFFAACKRRGIALAIDDFGTGYSSLSYLTRLPISKIKIDRSFVGALGREKDDLLVKALIDIGHQLGNRVVAEGVETRAQLDCLDTFGCDDVQGYLISPPTEAAEIERRLLH